MKPGQLTELKQRAYPKLNKGEPDGIITGGRQRVHTTNNGTNAVLGLLTLTPFTRPASACRGRRERGHPQPCSVSCSAFLAHAKSRNPADGGSIHASGRLRDPFEATAHLVSSACSPAAKPIVRPARAGPHTLSPVTPPPGPATADGAGDDASSEHQGSSLPASSARPPPPAEGHPPPSEQKHPR